MGNITILRRNFATITYESTYTFMHIIIDVSVTATFPNTQNGALPVLGNGTRSTSMTMEQALRRGASATTRNNEKNAKYRALANAAGIEFIALVFESCGRMHERVSTFLM